VALRLPVDRSGQITVPRVGPITVAGVRAGELDAFLKRQVGKVYANFELSATVGKLRTIQVYVVGQARAPGAYTVSSLSNLVSAVFESGGPSATGSMRRIELVRAGQKVATLDLYQFIQAGSIGAGAGAEGGDQRLLPGDVIVVPPAGPRVALTGALDNPGIFELATPEEPIAKVLGYSGSSTLLATPHKVLVERVNNQKASAPREVEERTLDAQGQRTMLRDGDLVTLLKIKPQFANAVTLRGNVAQPLRYAFKPGMRIADLIPEPEALIVDDYYTRKNILVQAETGRSVSVERASRESRTVQPEINWDYASVERLNRGEIQTRIIPFNLGKAIRQKDPQHNLVLEPGDVVTIYSANEIAVPLEKRAQFVKVTGEVMAPGVYQIAAGETLPQLIQRAGGFSRNAYTYGTVFSRESTRVQQQANLDAAIRRLEGQVMSQASTTLQNVNSPENALALQGQAAAQRQALERLRNLKASGRIALELQPGARAALPPIRLEDGDVVEVPSNPSFVAVFGAVFAENSFIHREGQTVADYIERAGLMRDADVSSTLLVRADGTVLSNGANRSLFGLGGGFMSTRVSAGDSIFVPEQLDKRTPYTQFIQGAKDLTQIFFQFGLSAAAVKTLRN
jgi:protein involved in polysaccharide export with SLBB domain